MWNPWCSILHCLNGFFILMGFGEIDCTHVMGQVYEGSFWFPIIVIVHIISQFGRIAFICYLCLQLWTWFIRNWCDCMSYRLICIMCCDWSLSNPQIWSCHLYLPDDGAGDIFLKVIVVAWLNLFHCMIFRNQMACSYFWKSVVETCVVKFTSFC